MKKQANNRKAVENKRVAEAAKEAGMSVADFTELALRWMADMTKANPVFVRSECREVLAEKRSGTRHETVLHPFMEQLFSRDLQAVHGPTFGERSSEHVLHEHVVFREIVERILDMPIGDASANALGFGRMILSHPPLRNEAMALIAFSAAYDALIDSCNAISNV